MASSRHGRTRMGDGSRDWALVAWSALICGLVLAPLAAPGYVLSYDMVAVPDQALVPSAVGLSSAMPRAVPLDAVVAVVDTVVPGAVLQRMAIGGIVVGAALGAGLALPGGRGGARLVAASVYGWNAYVFERLVVGHWPTLIAYAVLPWLLIVGRRVRQGHRGAATRGVLLVGLASLTATGGLIASVLFGALLLAPGGLHRRRIRVACLSAVVGLQAPWIVPGLLQPEPAVSDPAGVAAFAARADSPFGLFGSLATLGGIWNAGAVPDSRALASAAVLTGVVIVLAAAGLRELQRLVGRAELIVLIGLAAIGFVLALAAAVPGGGALLQWLVDHVPGSGLIRDGQKFLAWYALLVALAAAAGAARIARALRGRIAALLVTGVAAALPIAALPDLAWGAAGRLSPVEYPAEWAQVRTVLRESELPGDLVILPFQPFRAFPWTRGRIVLDPAPRYLGVEAVVPDALPVSGSVVPGEDGRAARVATVLQGDRPLERLAAAGVGWIAVQRDTPGAVPDGLLAGAEPVEINGTLDLYRVPGRVERWTSIPPAAPVIAAHIVSLVILAVASADVVRNACLGRRRSLRSPVS